MANNSPDSTTVFEFNAPQFLNFTSPNVIADDDGADKFFDTLSDAEHRSSTQAENSNSSHDIGSSSVVTSTLLEVQNTNDERSECSTDVEHGSSNINLSPATSLGSSSRDLSPFKSEMDYLSNVMNAKVQEAKAAASARAVKRAFAPGIEYSKDDPASYKIVAVELCHPGIRVQPHKKYTKVEPFSFEERNKRLQKEKEEKIKKILEEERKMHEFHANPVPRFIEPTITYNTVICTDPKEPKLRTEERLQERKKNKIEDDKNAHQFKAQPAVVLHKPPFEPKKAEWPLTDVTGFRLNTEERAKKREEFNILIKKKEAELELIRLQRKKEEEEILEEEIRRLRKEAVHKAKPVPVFKPTLPIKSNLPLTEPKSPCFASRHLIKSHKH